MIVLRQREFDDKPKEPWYRAKYRGMKDTARKEKRRIKKKELDDFYKEVEEDAEINARLDAANERGRKKVQDEFNELKNKKEQEQENINEKLNNEKSKSDLLKRIAESNAGKWVDKNKKNILIGTGIATAAGLGTYGTVKAIKSYKKKKANKKIKEEIDQ